MADFSATQGGSPGGKGGIPTWLLIGGSIAGILGLIVLMGNKQSSSTAAGTSINAALGSLQQQLTDTQGLVGTSAAQTQGLLSTYSSQIYGNVSAQGTQEYNTTQAAFANLQALIFELAREEQATQAQLNGMSQQHQATAASGTF